MRIVVIFCFFGLTLNVWAQNKYSNAVKDLSLNGLTYYYNADLEANIEAWIANDGNSVSEILGIYNAYENDLEMITKTNGLPWFVKYIPAANTGFNVHYASNKDGAKGIWPLPIEIANKYNLQNNSFIDERMVVAKSSQAACDYLKALYAIYKDWQKVILAFRIGPVKVNQYLHLSKSVLVSDFYSILSEEDKIPLNQFYAALVVLKNAKSYGIIEKPLVRTIVDTASCELPTTFDIINKFTGISSTSLKDINPHLLLGSVPSFSKTGYFNVPANQKKEYQKNRDTIYKYTLYTLYPPIIYDTLVSIVDSIEYLDIKKRDTKYSQDWSDGKRFVVSIKYTPKDTTATIIPEKNTITAIKEKPIIEKTVVEEPVQVQKIEKPKVVEKPKSNTLIFVNYTVKKKDGLYTLSDIFDCNIEDIKKWNNLNSNGIFIGQKLKFKVQSDRLAFYKKMESLNADQKKDIAAKD